QGSGFKVQGPPSTFNLQPSTYIVVATTRPETMLGDTAIAVHPKDKRYTALVGKTAVLPLVNRSLTIIANEAIDPEFGTGAVKVTPAHDPVDFQLGKKHELEFINVMTNDGHMTNVPKAYEGLDRFEARQKVMEDLEVQGLVEKITDHLHAVGHCYRCDTVVEPRLSLQWFVKMKPLAKPAIKAVKKGQIEFTPSRWTKVYLNWMDNIQDWCISRQIWWGHRLPVYYCQKCASGPKLQASGKSSSLQPAACSQPGTIVSKVKPERCPVCGSTDLRQDEDVLDTWFSSWLWPFSTLGWPKKTEDLEYFYPTDTLVTAPEIIFFWVARMIMAGYFCMGELPFRKVYIHGTVRDLTGKKMSKSLGNIIDPLEIIDQFGADALRYTLVTSTAVGTDVFISSEKFTIGRNFANKLWNVTRFVLSQPGEPAKALEPSTLSDVDRWILSRLQQTISQATTSLEAFNFNEAARVIYDFLWHDYCDWYVEIAKIQLAPGSRLQAPGQSQAQSLQPAACSQVVALLLHMLETSLRLLHPIMPFVTEELWQHLNKPQATSHKPQASELAAGSLQPAASIMVSPWPKVDKKLVDEDAEEQVALFQAVVTAIRNTKAELNVPIDTHPPVQLSAKRRETRQFFEAHRPFVQALAHVGDVTIGEAAGRPRDAAATVVDGVEVIVPLAGFIDVARERTRIQARVAELAQQLERLDAQLRDSQFTERAPKEIVEQAKAKRAEVADTHNKFASHLQLLQAL
ncbi:MAG: valine--tRNA ligase, partial [Candidatus Omnitrophica bacterium]|nr:valine--tRNA ligase [Candidatus Omnitrophota bacterium]